MKKRDLESALRKMAYTFKGGGKHDKWVNKSGSYWAMVPRHSEVAERLAHSILKKAEEKKDE